MTIIRMPSGKLLLHSPIKYSPELAGSICELGEIAFIITPNNFHGLYVDEWLANFSDAKYYTAKNDSSENSTITLSEALSEELESSIAVIKISGISKLNEFGFIHKESDTLILTDLAFNFDSNVSLWSKLFFRLNGCYEKFGPSKLMRSMIDSPDKLKESIENIDQYDFSRIIVSHGNIVEKQAKEVFRNAFNPIIAGAEKKTAKFNFSLSKCG